MQQIHDDYRQAQVRAYQSMGIGCLLVAVALVFAIGAAMWVVVWYFTALMSFGQ
jgi:hypothetical protein